MACLKIDKLCARLHGSEIFCSHVSDCYHIGLSPEAQKKSIFITPVGTFEVEKVPFVSPQVQTHFQELMHLVLQGPGLC